MKKIITFFKIAISGFLAICILSCFCFFYCYTPFGVADETESTIRKSQPLSCSHYMKEGFSWKKTDANGYYNKTKEQSIDPEILIAGSSHFEALQISESDTVEGILNSKYKTYSLGVSGQFIDQCLCRLPKMVDTYHPSKYIILETNGEPIDKEDLKRALEQYGNPEEIFTLYNHLSPKLAKLYAFVRTFIPSAVELYEGFNNWANAERREKSINKDNFVFDQEYEYILNSLISKASNTVKNANIKLIIVSRKKGHLESDGSYTIPGSPHDYDDKLNKICKKTWSCFVRCF